MNVARQNGVIAPVVIWFAARLKSTGARFAKQCQYWYNWLIVLKPLAWIGHSKADLLAFPPDTIREMGHALYLAQCGEKHDHAKPLKGFSGASVLEVGEDYDGDKYRPV